MSVFVIVSSCVNTQSQKQIADQPNILARLQEQSHKVKPLKTEEKIALAIDLALVALAITAAVLILLSNRGVSLGPLSGIGSLGDTPAYALIGIGTLITTSDVILLPIKLAKKIKKLFEINVNLGKEVAGTIKLDKKTQKESSTISRLEQEKQASIDQIKTTEQKINQLELQLQQVNENNKANLMAQKRKADQTVQALHSSIQKLDSEIKNCKEHIKKASEKADDKTKQKINELDITNKELKGKLKLEEKIIQLQEELVTKQQEFQSLVKDQLDPSKVEIEFLTQSIAKQTQDLVHLKNEQQILKSEYQDLQKIHQEKKDAVEKYNNEVLPNLQKKAQEQEAALQKKADEAKNKSAEALFAAQKELQKIREQIKEEMAKAQKKIDAKIQAINAVDITAKEQDLKQLENECLNTKLELENLTKQREAADKKYRALKMEASQKNQDLISLEQQIKKEQADFKLENENYSKQIQSSKNQLHNLRPAEGELNDKILPQLFETFETLSENVKTLQNEITTLNATAKIIDQQNKESLTNAYAEAEKIKNNAQKEAAELMNQAQKNNTNLIGIQSTENTKNEIIASGQKVAEELLRVGQLKADEIVQEAQKTAKESLEAIKQKLIEAQKLNKEVEDECKLYNDQIQLLKQNQLIENSKFEKLRTTANELTKEVHRSQLKLEALSHVEMQKTICEQELGKLQQEVFQNETELNNLQHPSAFIFPPTDWGNLPVPNPQSFTKQTDPNPSFSDTDENNPFGPMNNSFLELISAPCKLDPFFTPEQKFQAQKALTNIQEKLGDPKLKFFIVETLPLSGFVGKIYFFSVEKIYFLDDRGSLKETATKYKSNLISKGYQELTVLSFPPLSIINHPDEVIVREEDPLKQSSIFAKTKQSEKQDKLEQALLSQAELLNAKKNHQDKLEKALKFQEFKNEPIYNLINLDFSSLENSIQRSLKIQNETKFTVAQLQNKADEIRKIQKEILNEIENFTLSNESQMKQRINEFYKNHCKPMREILLTIGKLKIQYTLKSDQKINGKSPTRIVAVADFFIK